ncbi:CD3324 family protein [Schinkia sp. CFF1]
MNYVKAAAVLPQELIKEIQKYVQGEMIYIPKPEGSHQKWGARSGARKSIADRNVSIKQAFRSGSSIKELAEEYFLSIESIKKIVYSNK